MCERAAWRRMTELFSLKIPSGYPAVIPLVGLQLCCFFYLLTYLLTTRHLPVEAEARRLGRFCSR